MSEISMNRMLSDLNRLAAQARAQVPANPAQAPVKAGQPPEITSFGSLFTKAVNEVNNAQMTAAKLKTAFEAGEPGVDLPQVMVAANKASVAFEATLEVRKQLLKAYQEVMNMSV